MFTNRICITLTPLDLMQRCILSSSNLAKCKLWSKLMNSFSVLFFSKDGNYFVQRLHTSHILDIFMADGQTWLFVMSFLTFHWLLHTSMYVVGIYSTMRSNIKLCLALWNELWCFGEMKVWVTFTNSTTNTNYQLILIPWSWYF